jgi:hypothetical protein
VTPIEQALTTWHEFVRGDRDALDRVLADDAVLHSPVLFSPQRGKDLVKLYLTGASMTFVGDRPAGEPTPKRHPDGGEWDGRFRYVREVLGEHDAVLEFETTMQGKYVNGVDMIRCDDDGRIVDVKVMVRPQQAVEAVRELMMAALEQLKG